MSAGSTPGGSRGRYDRAAVEALATRLRRWGRWGEDDQLGALNFIDAEAIRGAASLVRAGEAISLALSLEPNPTRFQKTLGLNDFYWGADDFGYPLGHIQMLGKTDGQMLRAGAPKFTPPFALDYVKNDADRKVMELYLTQKTVARPVIAPPSVPADRLAALRAGFAALVQDQEFLADARKTKLDVSPVTGEEVDRIVALIASASPETARRLGAAISDK